MASLPDDTAEWTDDDWLAWLAVVDAEAGDAEPEESGRRVRPRPRRRVGAQLMAAAMTGLQEAIYGPKDKHAIVIEAPGDPPDDEPLTLHLDPDHPERSVARLRPWLLRKPRS